MIRREYRLRGVVQGVGFRPHVAAVAARHLVTGLVGNDDSQVFVEAQGEPDAVAAFLADVLGTLPPLARVLATTTRPLPPRPGEAGFRIVASRRAAGARTLIPPDIAPCPDCLAELADPTNRRYRYPFTNCTNCGPRLTIIRDLPYDRPATTMAEFGLCPACRAEYTDPADRRYHAQPISCPDCGPVLWLAPAGAGAAAAVRPDPVPAQGAVLAETVALLRGGATVAVKGLGGFHLCCDARNPDAVARLRARKRRAGKPFAVLVATLEEARRLADLTDDQAALLASPARPIVIAPQAAGYDLAPEVAPGLGDVGLLLPYTPLHSLLLDSGLALVATSGNLSEEPLCHSNDDALERLAGLCDALLLHDRGIHVPVEDSVFLAGSVTIPVRRSRGYAPLPVPLPGDAASGPPVLAVGGELKNTFALAVGDLAFVSAHQGDMGSWAAQRALEASVGQLLRLQRAEPAVVACDLHPGYATTGWAERYAAGRDLDLVRVQHHHAHALALLAEHGRPGGPAVVATLDGTGYGSDGTIWGGEVLTVGSDPARFERSWHVPVFPLVGGDRAIRQPWRVARGLASAYGLDIAGTPAVAGAPAAELRLVDSQLAAGVGVVATSSAGRLFDAAAALVGLCLEAGYEAQAAMEFERAACGHAGRASGATSVPELFAELLAEGTIGERAWRFHAGLAGLIAAAIADAAARAGTDVVGVSGGVAQNRLFLTLLGGDLRRRGLDPLVHRVVPPNDGGLSLGQAWAGRLLAAA
nr:carbamoyltransferase HypF [Propionibacterium sp.]